MLDWPHTWYRQAMQGRWVCSEHRSLVNSAEGATLCRRARMSSVVDYVSIGKQSRRINRGGIGGKHIS